MKKLLKKLIMIMMTITTILMICVLYRYNYIPHRKYKDEDFHIQTYHSQIDKDGDGIDDQSDILQNVKAYISTKPKYKSKYYQTGYPDDEYGVCTDVVAYGLKDAGYDLMELVNAHILANRELYQIDTVDKRIDFRRVRNLKVYFDNTAVSLTLDIYQIDQWQAGDIVIFKGHIGIISDHRNKEGIPFVIHHANPYQKHYEEDILKQRDDIIGHYRIS